MTQRRSSDGRATQVAAVLVGALLSIACATEHVAPIEIGMTQQGVEWSHGAPTARCQPDQLGDSMDLDFAWRDETGRRAWRKDRARVRTEFREAIDSYVVYSDEKLAATCMPRYRDMIIGYRHGRVVWSMYQVGETFVQYSDSLQLGR